VKILAAIQVVEEATIVEKIINPIIAATGSNIITDVKAGRKIVVTAGIIKVTSSITDAETDMKIVVGTGIITETSITNVVNRITVITGSRIEIEGDSVFAAAISTN